MDEVGLFCAYTEQPYFYEFKSVDCASYTSSKILSSVRFVLYTSGGYRVSNLEYGEGKKQT